MTWLAEQNVTWVSPDGTRRPGRIAVGAPVSGAGHATCLVLLDGLEDTRPTSGEGPLQALMLALQRAGYELQRFIADGGRVLMYEDEDDADANSAIRGLFGPLLRHPPPYDPKSVDKILEEDKRRRERSGVE